MEFLGFSWRFFYVKLRREGNNKYIPIKIRKLV